MKTRPLVFAILVLLLFVGGGIWMLLREPGDDVSPSESLSAGIAPDSDLTDFQVLPSILPLPDATPAIPLPKAREGVIPGEFTVFFKDAESMQEFREAAEAKGLRVLGGIDSLLALRIAGSAGDLSPLLKEGMEVDANFLMTVPSMPDLRLWQTANFTSIGDSVLQYLGIPASPDRLSWGKGTTIAILDTGWLGHEAVTEGRVRSIDLLGTPATQGDFAGHGTAVAGLISSAAPFAPGVAPGSDILAIRVLGGNGQGDAFTLAEGIITAVENGAQIINMSLGGYGDSEVLRRAVEFASENGVLMIAASGNDGRSQLTYPAAYSSVIGVTAVDANDNRAPFSNYGEGVDLAAPGYQIHALWEDDDFVYFNGTSASTPLVAGVAAHILESGMASTADEVRQILVQYANDTGPPDHDLQYGYGILNAERIEAAGTPGIYDVALADLYPAIEEKQGGSFPLYITLQNRGTEYMPEATVDITVNGTTPYFYRYSGLNVGEVKSIQLPIPDTVLESDTPYKIEAKVSTGKSYPDQRPGNNEGSISLSLKPGE